MSDIVNISKDEMDETGREMEQLMNLLQEKKLGSCDDRSTIVANENSKTAFTNSQQTKSLFAQYLSEEANRIKGLGATFDEYDQMLADIFQQQASETIKKAKSSL